MQLEQTTIKKVIAQINDGDVEEAASTLEILKRNFPYATPEGRALYKAHEQVTIGVPDHALHYLESLVLRYEVKFFDVKKGGVKIQRFVHKSDAEKFAATNRLYAKPCVVKEIDG